MSNAPVFVASSWYKPRRYATRVGRNDAPSFLSSSF
jgi:hypothetical protein